MSALLRRLALVPALYLAANVAYAGDWTDLWITRDQQGQRLLDEQHPQQAARVFTDARRRGYAQLAAGQYADAARLLAPYKDPDSQYNRGNALARAGKLEEALAAYNAALAASPNSRDIIKNRDLVEQALKRRKPSDPRQNSSQPQKQGAGSDGTQQSSAGESKPGSQPGHPSQASQPPGGNPPAGKSQAGDGGQHGRDGAGGQSPQQAQQAPPRSAQRQTQTPDGGSPPNQLQSGHAAARNAAAPPAHAGNQADQSARADTAATDAVGTDRATVRREIADTLQSERHKSANAAPPPQKPRSEQALALDQWLRSIPDDSGELLQRKFMIEHLMRQRDNAP